MFSLIWILCNNALKSEQVLKKFGVEKFDPINEKFDPSRHCAIFQIPDPSKPPGIVASVVKVCLHKCTYYLFVSILSSMLS